MGRLGGDSAGARLPAAAAPGGAAGPGRPAADSAVDGARLRVARLRAGRGHTDRGKHIVGPGATARVRRVTRAPHVAVARGAVRAVAVVSPAFACVLHTKVTVASRSGQVVALEDRHVPGAAHQIAQVAVATVRKAAEPVRVVRRKGTRVGVQAIGTIAVRAPHRAHSGAGAALFGARGPRAGDPVGALVGVALLRLRQDRARGSTKGRLRDDGASRRLRAATASGRAPGPGRPRRHSAGDGAPVSVARLLLRHHGTGRATIGRGRQHPAGLHLGAAVARLGARGPRGPSTHHAVDGAALGIARLRLRQDGAPVATEGHVAHHRPGLRLRAATAGPGARRPRRPATDLAVDRAGLCVARL